MRRLTKEFGGAALGLGSAALPLFWLFGFTVDDALITARVAHQLATGHGYRFNADGPVVDAVTPLGFSYLLAPAGGSGPMAALLFAKWLGALSWLGAAALLGREAARSGRLALATLALGLASCLPLSAWAGAGMETGLVTALATLPLLSSVPVRFAAAFAGLAAGLRPELGAWALVLAMGRALLESPAEVRFRRAFAAMGLALGPLVVVAAIRIAVFGQAYPLAVVAKPSDTSHGALYAVSAALHAGPPWLVVAGWAAYRRLSPRLTAVAMAALAHFAVLVLVGGDWMPLYRLAVPVLPGLVLVGVELNRGASSWWPPVLRLGVMLAASLQLALSHGASAAGVGAQRSRLIDEARPALSGARRVGTLDVGWVGAATPETIVDFAGVTDPSVARLAGGHTTKRLPADFLERRRLDALVLLTPARGVEMRVQTLDGFEQFRPVATVPLAGTKQSYVVYRR